MTNATSQPDEEITLTGVAARVHELEEGQHHLRRWMGVLETDVASIKLSLSATSTKADMETLGAKIDSGVEKIMGAMPANGRGTVGQFLAIAVVLIVVGATCFIGWHVLSQ